jgi:hypothetical protein
MKWEVARYSDINLVARFGHQCGSVHQPARAVHLEDDTMRHAHMKFVCPLIFGFGRPDFLVRLPATYPPSKCPLASSDNAPLQEALDSKRHLILRGSRV